MTRRIYRLGGILLMTGLGAFAQDVPPDLMRRLQEKERVYTPEHPEMKRLLDQVQGKQIEGGAQQMSEALLKQQGLFRNAKGRWWANQQTAEMLGLTSDQVKRMDDIFQQHRLRLIDLNAALEKEELILEPLMNADQPDDSKVTAQIDRVAQARAELEKANSRMLWSIRRVLTPEQYRKLQSTTYYNRPIPAKPFSK